MRHGVNITELQHGGKRIQNDLWKLSLFIRYILQEFEKRELVKALPQKATSRTLRISKHQRPEHEIFPAITRRFMNYFLRKLENTEKDKTEKDKTRSVLSLSTYAETHFLLAFIPLFTGDSSTQTIRSLTHNLSEEKLLSRTQLCSERPLTPKQYCQRALEINDSAEYATSKMSTRQTRLHFVSNVICRNLNETFRFKHSWLTLSTKQAILFLESKLRASRRAMHLFWYFFWRGDTIESRVLLCITTFQLQESFLRRFSDVPGQKNGSLQDSESYSVLPTNYDLSHMENLPFYGTVIATRMPFSPHRVSRLYMCEASHHPKNFMRQMILSEYYEKYHVVRRLKMKTNASLSEIDGGIKYGCYEKIPNVWRFMLQQASGRCETEVSTTIRLFECVRRINKNFQRAESVHTLHSAKLTPLEILQRKIGLKIDLTQSTIARQNRKKMEILPHEKRLQLFVNLSMQMLKSSTLEGEHQSYSVATQTSGRSRKKLYLPSELSSFLEAFVSCYTTDEVKMFDFTLIKRTLEGLFIPTDNEVSCMLRVHTLPEFAETLYSREAIALWCGWKVAAVLLGKSIDSITSEGRHIKSKNRAASHLLRWRALEAIMTTLRFTSKQAFVAFLIQTTSCIGESDRMQPISTTLAKIVISFLRSVFSKAGKAALFQSLSVVLFLIHTRLHHSSKICRQSPDVEAWAAKYTDRLVRQTMASQPFRARQRSSHFKRSPLILPFTLIVNPTVAKVLCSYGYWESALMMHNVLHSSYADTMKRIALTDQSQTVQCNHSQASRGVLAMILMSSQSSGMWRAAADYLHSSNPKGDVQVIEVRNSDDMLIHFRTTCALVCSRLCLAGDFARATALTAHADGIVKESLHPTDLREIILFLLRERRNWHSALQVASTLRQNLQSKLRYSACNNHFESTTKTWMLCLAYTKCTTWVETLRQFCREIEVLPE